MSQDFVSPGAKTKKLASFRSQFDRFSRKQRPVLLEAEIVDNNFHWDVLKNMLQIKNYDDMFQAIRALTVQKILTIRIFSQKSCKMKAFLVSLKCLDLIAPQKGYSHIHRMTSFVQL